MGSTYCTHWMVNEKGLPIIITHSHKPILYMTHWATYIQEVHWVESAEKKRSDLCKLMRKNVLWVVLTYFTSFSFFFCSFVVFVDRKIFVEWLAATSGSCDLMKCVYKKEIFLCWINIKLALCGFVVMLRFKALAKCFQAQIMRFTHTLHMLWNGDLF